MSKIKIKATKNAPELVQIGNSMAEKKDGYFHADTREFADWIIAEGHGVENAAAKTKKPAAANSPAKPKKPAAAKKTTAKKTSDKTPEVSPVESAEAAKTNEGEAK